MKKIKKTADAIISEKEGPKKSASVIGNGAA